MILIIILLIMGYLDSKLKPSNNHSSSYILWYEGNPFARIRCRSVERMCTWVCWACKKERDAFLINRVATWKKYFETQEALSGGDPYDENPSTLLTTPDPEDIVKMEIAYLANQKSLIFLWQHPAPALCRDSMGKILWSNPLH